MQDVASLAQLLDYELWAAAGVARSLSTADAPAVALGRFAHLAGTHALWLARVEGRDAPLAVWPALDVLRSLAGLRDALGAWRRLLAEPEQLARRVTYVNSAGQSWSNSVAEILTHVLLHSAYHRGQIASDLRACGLQPASTDYIQAVRAGELPR